MGPGSCVSLSSGDSDAGLGLRTTGLRKVQYRCGILQKGAMETPQGESMGGLVMEALQSHCFIGEYHLLILDFWRV